MGSTEEKLTLAMVDKMSVVKLVEELQKRNADTEGQKAVLKHRLMTIVVNEEEDENQIEKENEEQKGDKNESNQGDESDGSMGEEDDKLSNCSGMAREIRCVNFRDVEDSLEKFSGDDTMSIEKWVEDLEDLGKLLRWSDLEKLIYGRKLLNGAAKQFIRSEKSITTWKQLKQKLMNEFKTTKNTRDVHEQLRRRYKRVDETYKQYLYDMIAIGNQISLDAESLISYVIDGIKDSSVDKIVLRGATNIKEFKQKLDDYQKLKHDSTGKDSQNKKMNASKTAGTKNVQSNQKIRKIRCFNCGESGHAVKECPRTKDGPKCFKCKSFGHLAKDCADEISYLEEREKLKVLKINENEIRAIVDTGSAVNLIREDIYKKYNLPEAQQTDRKFTGIGSAKITPVGQISVVVEIDEEKYSTIFYIIPQNDLTVHAILGNELLSQAEVTFTPDGISFKKLETTVDLNNEIETQIMNINVEEDEIELNVNTKYKDVVAKMIKNYRPRMNVQTDIQTKLILTDESPVYLKPRRLAPLEKRILQNQVEEWLNNGIIRKSTSDFASPVVIVKKKDGNYRVCVDFRKVNQKIVKDRYPMPNIEEQLDKLVTAKVFTTIDLKNGFFHVPMAEESCKYTAFLTNDDHYEFIKTPFGLCNSPASFGRFIADVFKDLVKDGTVIHYVDDLIIPSNNFEDGIEKLKKVLKVAENNGLQINWSKCQFLQTSVEYLGHLIEDSKVRPSPRKIKAIVKFQTPKTIKQVQSFLGLSSYFRKFIPNHAKIALPLTNLLKKNSEFKFGAAEEHAFSTLKNLLSSEPVL